MIFAICPPSVQCVIRRIVGDDLPLLSPPETGPRKLPGRCSGKQSAFLWLLSVGARYDDRGRDVHVGVPADSSALMKGCPARARHSSHGPRRCWTSCSASRARREFGGG